MNVAAASATGDDRRVARYLRRVVYPYSAYYQALAPGAAPRLADLPPTDLGEIADPGTLVLRPSLGTIMRGGQRSLAVRAALAKAVGGMHQFNERVVEHQFKPIHWVVAGGVPIGYSAADLQRLAVRGHQWLARAGVGREDVVVSLLAPGPTIAHWQLVLGCRRDRVSAIHLDPSVDPAWVEGLAPSVLAGEPTALTAVLERARSAGHPLTNLRTVLAIGAPLDASTRTGLQGLAPEAAVVGAWAPDGVRSLWTECRAAIQWSDVCGYHTWADDVLETAPDGEMLWTGVGWRGSAVLRLRTHTQATVARDRCPACGREEARVFPDGAPSVAARRTSAAVPVAAPVPVAVTAEAVLAAEPDVAAWQIEHRVVDGRHETLVVLAPTRAATVPPLVRRLDRHLAAAQYIVLPVADVRARVAASGSVVGDRPS